MTRFYPHSETQRELSLTSPLSTFGTARWTIDNIEECHPTQCVAQ